MNVARALAVLCAGLPAGCANSAPQPPLTHVDRVIEDVTAMVEGMMQAHSGPRGLAEIPPSPRS